MAAVTVDVQIACGDATMPPANAIESWVVDAARRADAIGGRDLEISVRIVDAPEMQALNRQYRDKDAPTNVLSFPTGDIDGLPADAPRSLGDIVVCAPVVAAEAAAQGKPHEDHWAHMLVHGVLHLFGFDHDTDREASIMEDLERSILAAGNVTDPYT